ncbi:MAG: hypothetical protein K5673_02520 [Lachnospiraceae bacterium]|nr:hypothetical protein [Lachnospiraceae bacterium]MCR4595638.1 hypothetical protein [Lachnospiraceae bacterium]
MSLLKEAGYTLVIMEDEPTALSGSIPTVLQSRSTVFLATSLMIILISAIVLAAAYAIRLHQLQSRLDELLAYSRIDAGDYNPRSIRSIRNQILIVESDIAESNLGGMIPSMY